MAGEHEEIGESTVFNGKIILLSLVGFLTFACSMVPWAASSLMSKRRAVDAINIGAALAAGIMFGAFMSTMVPETQHKFHDYMEKVYGHEEHHEMIEYPWASIATGGMFLILFSIEKWFAATAGGHGHSHGLAPVEPPSPRPSPLLTDQGKVVPCDTAGSASPGSADSPRPSTSAGDNACTDCAIVAVNMAISPVPGDVPANGARCDTHAEKGVEMTMYENKMAQKPLQIKASQTAGASEEAVVAKPAAAAAASDEMAHLTGDAPNDGEAQRRAWIFVLAMCLHAIFDGMSVGAAQSIESFYSIMLAVASHKALDGLAAGAAVFPAKFRTIQAVLMLILCSIMTPIGVGIGLASTHLTSETSTLLASAIVVSLSAGSFLFISIVELLPAALADGRLIIPKLLAAALGWAGLVVLAGFHVE